jgi:putative hydrolase of the HAD superfamily
MTIVAQAAGSAGCAAMSYGLDRMSRLAGQHLVFDADDTLWESNVIFEQVISDFLDWLEHPQLGRDEIRRILDDIEHANSAAHGYGTKVFTRSLEETFREVAAHEPRAEDLDTIRGLVRRLAWEEIEIIPGVPETLAELAARHDLVLLTKGEREEQQLKIDASGLAELFRRAVIVPEKDVETYRRLVTEERLDPALTWMIGNSPRSDILPAVEAGLRAAHVPHPHTWRLEHAQLPDEHPSVLRLPDFRGLLDYF